MQKTSEDANSVWLDYIHTKEQRDYSSSVFCFFEGEDRKYYLERIRSVYTDIPICPYTCGNRKNVTDVYKKIISEDDTTEKLLFFIDRDFNLDSYYHIPHIYQTPEYSIENLYCKTSTIKKIMETEFGMLPGSKDIEYVTRLYDTLLSTFLDYYSCVNIWYLACKNNHLDVMIDKFKPHKDFDLKKGELEVKNNNISSDKIIGYYREQLQKDLESKKPHSEQNLKAYIEKEKNIKIIINELTVEYDYTKDFRGKFLFVFLKKFIGLIKSMNKQDQFEFKYPHAYIDENQKNLLSACSSYAVTPECLTHYLLQRKKIYDTVIS